MEITKTKLPKGLTYPLSSELLDGALSSGGFNTPVVLRYRADSQLLAARYYLRRPWDDIERFVISSGSVDSRDSEEAKEYLVKTIVPEFVAWAHELASLPASSSRFTGHQFLQWVSPKNRYNSVTTVAIKCLIADKSHK